MNKKCIKSYDPSNQEYYCDTHRVQWGLCQAYPAVYSALTEARDRVSNRIFIPEGIRMENHKASIKRAIGDLHNAIEALHVAITTSGFDWAVVKAEEYISSANTTIERAKNEYGAKADLANIAE